MKEMLLGSLFICFFTLTSSLQLRAESSAPVWTSRIDWSRGELRIAVEAPVPRSGFNAPAGDIATERIIDQALPGIFREAVLDVVVDSKDRVKDILGRDPGLSAVLLDAGSRAKKGLSAPSTDLGRLSAEYVFPLHETLGAAVGIHAFPTAVARKLGWEPSASFTGVVIYAKGPLPVHGENRDAKIEPCLFPEIFDENMNPVLLTEMADPEYLRRWGSAAYASSFDEKAWDSRIGKTPLRIVAHGLFGRHYTDIKIHPEDAAKLLVNANNRRLLAEGRILIVTDPLPGGK